MEQRTLKIGGRVVYCYEDGSLEFTHPQTKASIRTFGSTNSSGYKTIRLYISGKRQSFLVHRLIALAFHPNPNNLSEVDHINRIKDDNRPCNLRWASREDNQANRDVVDNSIAKYGIRHRDNKKLYNKLHSRQYNACHVALHAIKPDGKETKYHFSSVNDPVYIALKPFSLKDRYYKYISLKNNRQVISAV